MIYLRGHSKKYFPRLSAAGREFMENTKLFLLRLYWFSVFFPGF